MAAQKTIVLITGATSGIGLELAFQLLSKGQYHVFLGARSSEKGLAAVEDLRAQHPSHQNSLEMLHLDVTEDSTIKAAAAHVQETHGHLDILVNNAAVSGMTSTNHPNLRDQMRISFDTNATGPAVITDTFTPLLQNSTSPSRRIINISSGAGSITRRLDSSSPIYKLQEVQYRASKAALSMVSACQMVQFEPWGFKVFLYDPGFTVSNLGPFNTVDNGARAVGESVRPLVEVIEGKRDAEGFWMMHKDGGYPW